MNAKEKAREHLNKYINDEFDLDEEVKIHPKRIEEAIDIAIKRTCEELKLKHLLEDADTYLEKSLNNKKELP